VCDGVVRGGAVGPVMGRLGTMGEVPVRLGERLRLRVWAGTDGTCFIGKEGSGWDEGVLTQG
jgi:hypothetical protein